jgi:hypothetical protein
MSVIENIVGTWVDADSGGLEWDLRICISNELLGNAELPIEALLFRCLGNVGGIKLSFKHKFQIRHCHLVPYVFGIITK